MISHAVWRSTVAALAFFLMHAAPVDAVAATVHTVVMKGFDFSPMRLTIAVGDTVIWTNLDGEPHTVTSADGLFRSGALDQNDTFLFKFTKAGMYSYVCSIHPKMMAAVIVR
jgi:plastocyanin